MQANSCELHWGCSLNALDRARQWTCSWSAWSQCGCSTDLYAVSTTVKRGKKLCSCIKISSNTWCELTQDVTTKFNPEKISILQSVSPKMFFKCQTKDLQVLRECRIYKMFHVWVSPSWNLSDWASRIDSRESWLLQDIPMKKRKNNLL